jgi:hypothetical protein
VLCWKDGRPRKQFFAKQRTWVPVQYCLGECHQTWTTPRRLSAVGGQRHHQTTPPPTIDDSNRIVPSYIPFTAVVGHL